VDVGGPRGVTREKRLYCVYIKRWLLLPDTFGGGVQLLLALPVASPFSLPRPYGVHGFQRVLSDSVSDSGPYRLCERLPHNSHAHLQHNSLDHLVERLAALETCHKILSRCTLCCTLRCVARGLSRCTLYCTLRCCAPAARRRSFSHHFTPPLLLAPLLLYHLQEFLQVVLVPFCLGAFLICIVPVPLYHYQYIGTAKQRQISVESVYCAKYGMEAALKLLSLDPPLALLYRSASDLYVFEPKRCSRVFGHSRMDIVVQFGVLRSCPVRMSNVLFLLALRGHLWQCVWQATGGNAEGRQQ
jgi:hypothetical protein